MITLFNIYSNDQGYYKTFLKFLLPLGVCQETCAAIDRVDAEHYGGERERSDRQCVWQVLQWRCTIRFTETVQRGLLQQVSQDDQQEGDLYTQI